MMASVLLKRKMQRAADVAMAILLPLLMLYAILGEVAHEWIGTAMFLLFIVHHILNYRWFKVIFKGKYTPMRILSLVTDILLLICMVLLMLSGIAISRHIYTFLYIGHSSLLRVLHLTCSHWGFLLMSFHVGLHIPTMFWSKMQTKTKAVTGTVISLISCYGIYTFVNRNIADYLFMKVGFVFADASEPFILAFGSFVSIMVLFSLIGMLAHRLCEKQ